MVGLRPDAATRARGRDEREQTARVHPTHELCGRSPHAPVDLALGTTEARASRGQGPPPRRRRTAVSNNGLTTLARDPAAQPPDPALSVCPSCLSRPSWRSRTTGASTPLAFTRAHCSSLIHARVDADVRSRQRSGRHFPAGTRLNRSKSHDPIQGHSPVRPRCGIRDGHGLASALTYGATMRRYKESTARARSSRCGERDELPRHRPILRADPVGASVES